MTRGKVKVTVIATGEDGGATTLLGAGDAGLFPREARPAVAPIAADYPTPSTRHGSAPANRGRAIAPRSRAATTGAPTRSSPGTRRSQATRSTICWSPPTWRGSPITRRRRLPYLQRILRDHPRDERAPMAAFTLGRTLSGLGRTREAMAQFARVRTGWPRSPLAEDALVREAEAAAALGDVAAAVRLAAEYNRGYPDGRRRSEVRRYARLE